MASQSTMDLHAGLPKKRVSTLLRENPYITGLAAVCTMVKLNTSKLNPRLIESTVCIAGWIFVWIRPRRRLGHLDHGVLWRQVPAHLLGQWVQRLVRVDAVVKYVCTLHSVLAIPFMQKLIRLATAAWFGSLVNGPIADRFGRKWSIIMAVVVFLVGSAFQAAAANLAMLFAGETARRLRLMSRH
jgi:hypothetical protein